VSDCIISVAVWPFELVVDIIGVLNSVAGVSPKPILCRFCKAFIISVFIP